ncbi:MAG TPA: transcription termination/antitermination protein NusG [Edaphocola sp.]|nr:transcription termination/antitermination protein NusG [Edaphocola sp.]
MSDTNQTQSSQDNKWLVLRVVSGKERKIKEHLDKEIRLSGWGNAIVQVLCPMEKVFKIQNGKKVLREKILFPGYLMIETIDGKFNDTMLQTIVSVTNVMHFLGKTNPTPLRKAEVNKMFGNIDDAMDQDISIVDPFIIGESIKIIDGPFNDFHGTVEELLEDKRKLKVSVKIFGRSQIVELNYTQVEKIV